MNFSEYAIPSGAYANQRTGALYDSPNPLGDILFARHWKWNHHNLPVLKNKAAASSPASSIKQEILLWFQSLSAKDKIACTTIHNSSFTSSFLKLLPLHKSDKIFNLREQKCIPTITKCTDNSYFAEILSSLRVAYLEQPILYFSSLDVIDMRMLEWLNRVSNHKIFENAQRGREVQQNLLWFNSASFHSLENWLVSELELSIIKNFLSKPQESFSLEEFKQFLAKKSKKIELQGLDMKLQSFNHKSLHQLTYLHSKIKEEEEKFHELKQQKLIQNMEKVVQPKKRGRRRQKNQKRRQSEHEKGIQISEEVKNLQNESISCPKETVTTHDDPHPHLQTDTGNLSPKVTSPTVEDSNKRGEQTQTQLPKQNTASNAKFSPPKRKSSASKNLIYVSPKRTRSPEHIRSSRYLEQGDIKQKYSEQDRQSSRVGEQSSQNNFSQKNSGQRDQINKRRRRKSKKQSEQYCQARKNIWNRLITRQLDNIVDQLNLETNSLYEFKSIAFERVRVFIQSIYPVANAILFGSNAIGLALPDSDVDILLYGLPCCVKQDASDFLAQIAVQINAMGWVVSCSTYLNAKVPIIKLEIDPSVPFLQTKRRQDLFQVYNPQALYYLDTDKTAHGRTIKVDITINIQGLTSVGYESTVLMKEWITKMPEIQKLIILFKYILAIGGYNSNFNGGIGSYCLFAMIASYLKSHPPASDADLSSSFLHILKWYGQDFDNLTYVVQLKEIGSCFIHEEQLGIASDEVKRTLLRLMDPITKKMMSSSCNEYNNIRSEFRRISLELNNLQSSIDEYLKENDVTTIELTKTLQTKKGLQKLVTRYESKCSPSVKAIIDRVN